MTTNVQKARFDAENTRQIRLKLNLNTDKDILDRLAAQPKETGGKQGYIKRLIRADIAKEEENDSKPKEGDRSGAK